jgi:hypothetical protein
MFTIRKAASNPQGTLHNDRYLTNFSEMFMQEERAFAASRVATNIPVLKESDKFVKYPRGYFWRDEVKVRPLGGRPVQASYATEPDNYNCEEWALEATLDDRLRANADEPINLEENATVLLTQKQMIRAERLWSGVCWGTGIWTNDYVGGADFAQFSDPNSDPIRVIEEKSKLMMSQAAKRPNRLVVGANVDTELRNHPDILDRIKYTQRGIVTDELLAALFGVEEYACLTSVYETAAEGATSDIDWINNPDAMLLCYVAPQAGLNTPTAVARFSWTGLVPGATNKLGGVISRGREDRAKSDWFQSANAFAYKKVSADLGIFFSGAVSPPSN